MKHELVIGTRGSDLALWQVRHVAARLAAAAECRIKIVRTEGDRLDDRPLTEIEGKGFFTKELEDALRSRTIDLAVHSLKDLPTDMPPTLEIAAVLSRADPRELLLVAPSAHAPGARPLELRRGARVGTSSTRREAQLHDLRPDLAVLPLRGNVPTRIRRLREGRYDAIVIAAAGVERLGLDLADLVAIPLDPSLVVPAPGQGALAVQIRSDDAAARDAVSRLHEPETAEIVAAERSLLDRLGGGCSLPLGAHVTRTGGRYVMVVFYAGKAGPMRVAEEGAAPGVLAGRVHAIIAAREAVAEEGDGVGRGARDGREPLPLRGARVVVTREATPDEPLSQRLRHLGADVVVFPVVRNAPDSDPNVEARVAGDLESFDWILFPSPNAVRRFTERLTAWGRALPERSRIGVVGPGTADALREHGRAPDLVPGRAISDDLLAELLDLAGGARWRVLIAGSRAGRTVLADGLASAGHDVVSLPVYRTAGPVPSELDRDALLGADYVVFASPSAVRNFLAVAPVPPGAKVVTIGPVTSAAARACGLDVHGEAVAHTVEGLIECLKKG